MVNTLVVLSFFIVDGEWLVVLLVGCIVIVIVETIVNMNKIETPVCPITEKCEVNDFDRCFICSLIHMQDVEMFMLRLKQFPWTIKKGGITDGKKKDEK